MDNAHRTSASISRIISVVSAAFLLFLLSASIPLLSRNAVAVGLTSSPQFSAKGNLFYVNSSFTVENHAYYAIDSIHYSMNFTTTGNSTVLFLYSTGLAAARPGATTSYNVSVPVYYSSLPPWFLREASVTPVNITFSFKVSASYALGFFSVALNHSETMSSSALINASGTPYLFAKNEAVGDMPFHARMTDYSAKEAD